MIWLIVALILAGAEVAIGDFTLLMFAGGAFAGAAVAALGAPLWGSVAAFIVVAAGLLFVLRPFLKKVLYRNTHGFDHSPQALVGKEATVLEDVTGHSGQVRLDGSIWSARSLDPGHTFTEGEHVHVQSIDGNTAVVWTTEIS